MQAEVPLPTEALERLSRLLKRAVTGFGDGIAKKERRDGCGRTIHRMCCIAGDVEEKLRVYLGNVHSEFGSQGLAGYRGPLAERVVSHAPIFLPPTAPSNELTGVSS